MIQIPNLKMISFIKEHIWANSCTITNKRTKVQEKE